MVERNGQNCQFIKKKNVIFSTRNVDSHVLKRESTFSHKGDCMGSQIPPAFDSLV